VFSSIQKRMKKTNLIVLLFIGLLVLFTGCIEIEDLEYVRFETYPKTTYLQDEAIEHFEVTYKIDGKDPVTTSSSDDKVNIDGFDTSSVGTYTMTIYITGFEDVTLDFVYNVVNSMQNLLFAGGSGTESSPYEISNAQHLSNIRFALDKHFLLIDDIDLAGIQWDPIGGNLTMESCGEGCGSWVIDENAQFTGSLNGYKDKDSNYTISNLSTLVDENDPLYNGFYGENYIENFALFSAVENATIKNVTLENVDLYGFRVASLAIVIRGGTLLENVEVASGTIKTSYAAGGVFVNTRETDTTESQTIHIKNVINRASLIGNRDSTYVNMMGGLLSQTSHSPNDGYPNDLLHIENFKNYGNITHLYSENSGTIAGQIIGQANNGNVQIKDSSGVGIITGNAINNAIVTFENGEQSKDWEWSFFGKKYIDENTISDVREGHYSSWGIEGKLVGRDLDSYDVTYDNSTN
jgi:hypothetical protein